MEILINDQSSPIAGSSLVPGWQKKDMRLAAGQHILVRIQNLAFFPYQEDPQDKGRW